MGGGNRGEDGGGGGRPSCGVSFASMDSFRCVDDFDNNGIEITNKELCIEKKLNAGAGGLCRKDKAPVRQGTSQRG